MPGGTFIFAGSFEDLLEAVKYPWPDSLKPESPLSRTVSVPRSVVYTRIPLVAREPGAVAGPRTAPSITK